MGNINLSIGGVFCDFHCTGFTWLVSFPLGQFESEQSRNNSEVQRRIISQSECRYRAVNQIVHVFPHLTPFTYVNAILFSSAVTGSFGGLSGLCLYSVDKRGVTI